jgi:hypothetical protein
LYAKDKSYPPIAMARAAASMEIEIIIVKESILNPILFT